MQAVEQFRNAMQTIDCSRVVEALHSIDPGVDRETWVRALTAFKAAGGAETTSQRAADLRGDAEGDMPGLGDTDAFDQVTV